MKWTYEKPREEGWFWWRCRKHAEKSMIVMIIKMPVTERLLVFSDIHKGENVKSTKGQWSDQPLTPPDDEKSA